MKGRFLTLNTIIRVNQIEARRDLDVGYDEFSAHSPENVTAFRNAVLEGFPEGKITWAMSYKALTNPSEKYTEIRKLVKGFCERYGDDATYIPGAYFSNAHSTREEVNEEMAEGLELVEKIFGRKPESLIAGFLSAQNQKYLSDVLDIHVCQGNIWSQYSIDNQDGDGSISYPYYPSLEHFCKPAQNNADFIDSVNLDGWTMDFVSARLEGATDSKIEGEYNSRMGVGPIETIARYADPEKGFREIMETTAAHFDTGYRLNGFGWVTNLWEISLIDIFGKLEYLTKWLKQIKERWPDTQFLTIAEFGKLWRESYRNNNNLNYRFIQKGSGIGGSKNYLEIRWYMNREFRLAILKNIATNEENVIDFTRYDIPAAEPQEITRNWSLMGKINQKQTRPQDKPVPFKDLAEEDKNLILKWYSAEEFS